MAARSEGYTLVELIVAMALMSLIAVTLGNSLYMGTAALSKSTAQVESWEDIRSLHRFLRRQIGAVYPKYDQRQRDFPLEGDADRLEFTAPIVSLDDKSALYRLTFAMKTSLGGSEFTVTWTPVFGSQITSHSTSTILARNVERVSFSYYRAGDRTRKGDWVASWQKRQDLPALVKVHIDFKDKDRTWPDLYVAPLLTADAGCVFDTVSRRCRRPRDD